MENIRETSSFKDMDSQVIIRNGEIYREIMFSYKENYDLFISSGLYSELTQKNLLIKHEECAIHEENIYKLIKPEKVFITYPWEWCFSQLKDAALATLKIQKIALNYDMSLKDANCYNIQFKDNSPIFIDTASFEKYLEGNPWCAYKQFCENFLAPLALMSYTDINLNKLFLSNINGIDLRLASKLLGIKSILHFDLFFHIKLHSYMQTKYEGNHKNKVTVKISKKQQMDVIDSLINCINNLKLKTTTEWSDYYNFTNYEKESFEHKKEIILEYKKIIKPENVWDFGANTGEFSRLFSNINGEVFSLDIDSLSVEKNYLKAKENHENNIRPIVFDIINPSPSVGWNNEERYNLLQRTNNPDICLALALIHHLRITYNIPFYKIRDYFAQISPYLIIEFVKKEDSQIQKMLMNRKDIFNDYTIDNFEKVFNERYEIINKTLIKNTCRYMYLMRRKNEV